jgi:hypothetical protein
VAFDLFSATATPVPNRADVAACIEVVIVVVTFGAVDWRVICGDPAFAGWSGRTL